LLFVGCNVENAAYGLSMCAERVVLFAARAAGPVEIADMLIVAALPEPISPCGACRQVMLELAPHARVLLANLEHTVYETTPENLLPLAFSNGFLRASHTLPHKDRR
jgi:cytidine deaminase